MVFEVTTLQLPIVAKLGMLEIVASSGILSSDSGGNPCLFIVEPGMMIVVLVLANCYSPTKILAREYVAVVSSASFCAGKAVLCGFRQVALLVWDCCVFSLGNWLPSKCFMIFWNMDLPAPFSLYHVNKMLRTTMRQNSATTSEENIMSTMWHLLVGSLGLLVRP